uniref:Uncharacterized protein n=1 Tax=Tanacetum cinerariifolium TaxID=118510 RepID=A0A6L2MES7_TANCI|nr:hypothetical protein [Tanacetum cinerariifolium]
MFSPLSLDLGRHDCIESIQPGYALDSTVHILNMVPTKKVERKPSKIWSVEGLELIPKEDTPRSKNTSEVHNEVAPIEVEPQNVKVPIRRSARIPQAPDRYEFYVDVEEYKLWDLNKPPNYKHAANIETDVDSNYSPYLDISRIFNDHTTKDENEIV